MTFNYYRKRFNNNDVLCPIADPDKADGIDACVVIPEGVLTDIKRKEALVRAIESMPDNSQINVTTIGFTFTQVGAFNTSTSKDTYKRSILKLKGIDKPSSELSATLLNVAIDDCFQADWYVAKILMVVGTSTTDAIGDLGQIINRHLKTFVMNLTPGSPLSHSISTLATDTDHIIDVDNLAGFRATLAFGTFIMYTLCNVFVLIQFNSLMLYINYVYFRTIAFRQAILSKDLDKPYFSKIKLLYSVR